MTFRRRRARLKRRLQGALNGWRQPRPLPFPVRKSAAWSDDVNFTRNEAVLQVLLPVPRQFLSTRTPTVVARTVAAEAYEVAYLACLNRESQSA